MRTACDDCPARLTLAAHADGLAADWKRLNENIAVLSSRLLQADPHLWVATMSELAAKDAIRRAQTKEPRP